MPWKYRPEPDKPHRHAYYVDGGGSPVWSVDSKADAARLDATMINAAGLPESWEERADADGAVYYYDPVHEQTASSKRGAWRAWKRRRAQQSSEDGNAPTTHDALLPPNWTAQRQYDAGGKYERTVYFFDGVGDGRPPMRARSRPEAWRKDEKARRAALATSSVAPNKTTATSSPNAGSSSLPGPSSPTVPTPPSPHGIHTSGSPKGTSPSPKRTSPSPKRTSPSPKRKPSSPKRTPSPKHKPSSPKRTPSPPKRKPSSPTHRSPSSRQNNGLAFDVPVRCPVVRTPRRRSRSRTRSRSASSRPGASSPSPSHRFTVSVKLPGLTRVLAAETSSSRSRPTVTAPSTYASVVDRLRKATRMSGARAVCVVEGTDAAYWSLACAEAAPTLRGVVATPSSTDTLHNFPSVVRAHVCALDAGEVAHWGCATHAVAVVADEAAYVAAVNRALRTPTLRGLAIVIYGTAPAAAPSYVSTDGLAPSAVQQYTSKAPRRRSGEPRVHAWVFKWTPKVQRSMHARHWSASPPGEGSVSRCLRI